MKRKSEPDWFNHRVYLKPVRGPGGKRARLRLYEYGPEFWLVESDAPNIHVYSIDKKWYGWFKLGVEVNFA